MTDEDIRLIVIASMHPVVRLSADVAKCSACGVTVSLALGREIWLHPDSPQWLQSPYPPACVTRNDV